MFWSSEFEFLFPEEKEKYTQRKNTKSSINVEENVIGWGIRFIQKRILNEI